MLLKNRAKKKDKAKYRVYKTKEKLKILEKYNYRNNRTLKAKNFSEKFIFKRKKEDEPKAQKDCVV